MSIEIVGGDLIAQITGGVFEMEEVPSLEIEGALDDSPASIIASHLMDESILSLPSLEADWPLYISHLPDVPDVAVGIYNTTPIKDGRNMDDGSIMQHYGVEIVLRCRSEEAGWDKCNEILTQLCAVHNAETLLGAANYRIHNVSVIGGINALGEEPGTKRRKLFTMNFITAINKL